MKSTKGFIKFKEICAQSQYIFVVPSDKLNERNNERKGGGTFVTTGNVSKDYKSL